VLVFFVTVSYGQEASAVRPFVTDDARLPFPGQLEVENYAQFITAPGLEPYYHVRSLQGWTVHEDWYLMTSLSGNHQGGQTTAHDLMLQPKYLIHRGFGIAPSLAVAAAQFIPLSGNRQQWNSFAMGQASWFLFTPVEKTDPYDNGLAIHLNLGTKSQLDAGIGGRYTSKLFWAGGVEAMTFRRDVRFVGEIFSGDPFVFEEKAPVFQVGFRWYKTADLQFDLVWKGARGDQVHSNTIQVGLRFLLDDVVPHW
jgi:hypothetical protein